MFARFLLPALVATLVAVDVATAVPNPGSPMPTEGRSNVTPLWSPDATRLAFVADAPGPNNHDLWLVRSDGSDALDLTPDDLNEASASWSPDGTRLAFTSAPILTSARPSVEVIDADGSNRHVLADGSKPAWSPDGRLIAYVADDGVHVIAADGSGDRFVAPTSEAPVGNAAWSTVSWSPDSRQLTYIRGNNVFAVDVDGSNLRRLTNFPAAPLRIAAAPSWAPDGSAIAFVVVGPPTEPLPQEIWDVRPDGSDLRRLASYDFVDSGASWTPAGGAIVYAAAKNRDGDVDIYRVGAGGGTPVDISNDRVWDEDPTVSPDGSKLAFDVRYGGGYLSSDVWILDLETGARRNMTGSSPGLTVDARLVSPPNRLVLKSLRAYVDHSFGKPILRVDVHVQDLHGDDVQSVVVTVKTRTRGLVTLRTQPTDVHGHTQWAARARDARALRHGTRITLTITAQPRGRYNRAVVATKRLVVRV
jgi:TolB protein